MASLTEESALFPHCIEAAHGLLKVAFLGLVLILTHRQAHRQCAGLQQQSDL